MSAVSTGKAPTRADYELHETIQCAAENFTHCTLGCISAPSAEDSSITTAQWYQFDKDSGELIAFDGPHVAKRGARSKPSNSFEDDESPVQALDAAVVQSTRPRFYGEDESTQIVPASVEEAQTIVADEVPTGLETGPLVEKRAMAIIDTILVDRHWLSIKSLMQHLRSKGFLRVDKGNYVCIYIYRYVHITSEFIDGFSNSLYIERAL